MAAGPGGGAVGSVLNYADNQIYDDGVNRLKLLLYAVLAHVWKELDKCEKPSEIYRMLKGHLGSEEKAMQMFLFALKAIGGSKRGKQTAKEASQILGPEHIPNELDFEQQTDKFRFFFWILKVAKRLPNECHEKLKQHYAKAQKVNYRFIKGIPQLFIQLYQDRVLSESDTSSLMKVLEDYEAGYKQDTQKRKDVQKCVAYLHKFHDAEVYPFSSGDEESSALSMYETDAHAGREAHPGFQSNSTRRQKKRKKRISESKSTSTPCQFPIDPEDTSAPKESSESSSSPKDIQGLGSWPAAGLEESLHLFKPKSGDIPCAASIGTVRFHTGSGSAGQPVINESHRQSVAAELVYGLSPFSGSKPLVPFKHSINANESEYVSPGPRLLKCFTRRRYLVLLLIILASVAVALPVGAVCSKYVWSSLHPQFLPDTKYREGNIPILGQVESFLTENVSVQQDVVDDDDEPHQISVFIVKENCRHLPITMNSTEFNEDQLSIHPIYMLEHSEIALHSICASTEAPESNPINFYVLKGISEYIDFKPHDTRDRYKFQHFRVGTHGKKN